MPTLAKPISYGPASAAETGEGPRLGAPFWISVGLHGGALALILLFTIALREKTETPSPAFELVDGEGNNFAATEAPAGSEAGLATAGEITFTAPESVPEWTPPPPVPEPTPVAPVAVTPVAEVPVAPVVKAEPKPDFSQSIKSTIRQEKRKAEREVRQERAAEAAAAKAAAAAEAKRQAQTSYAEFQKQQGAKAGKVTGSPGAAATNPGTRIDPNSIKKGVTGGTGAGSTGAGGTALSRAEGRAMDAYFLMLTQRVKESHENPGNISNLLSVDIQFTVAANGTISGARIVRSSGSADFDRSVLEALARVRMPSRPDKTTSTKSLTFRLEDA